MDEFHIIPETQTGVTFVPGEELKWTNLVYEREMDQFEEHVDGLTMGTSCHTCNQSYDDFLACTVCEHKFCVAVKEKMNDDRCIKHEELVESEANGGDWFCPRCIETLRVRSPDGVPNDLDDIRGMMHTTISPLMVISISPDGEPPCLVTNMIESSAIRHWRWFEENLKVVRFKSSISQSQEALKEVRQDIINFLRGSNFYKTRVLVVINTHSQIGTGALTLEIVKEKGGERTSHVTTVNDLLRRTLGSHVIRVMQKIDVMKGLILCACGYAINCDLASYQSLITTSTFSFVLAFSAESVAEYHLALGIHAFFRACFLEVDALKRRRPLVAALPVGWGSHVSFARIMAFGPQEEVQRVTGIVLLEAHQGNVVGTMFRRGQPTLRPYGLDGPRCPVCLTLNNISYRVKRKKLSFECTCGATSKGVEMPEGVHEVPVDCIPPNHYITAFPVSYATFGVTWTQQGKTSKAPWL